MNPYIHYQLVAAIMGLMSVAFGAFGAHSLKASFGPYEVGIWQTATEYLMFHTLLVAFATTLPLSKKITLAIKSAIVGNILFSGSLYLLALSGNKILGMVTPVGGLCYLVAWSTLAYHFYRQLTFKPNSRKG